MFRAGVLSHLTHASGIYKPMLSLSSNRPFVSNYVDVMPYYPFDCIQWPTVGIGPGVNLVGSVAPPQQFRSYTDVVPIQSPAHTFNRYGQKDFQIQDIGSREVRSLDRSSEDSEAHSHDSINISTSSYEDLPHLMASPAHEAREVTQSNQRRGVKRHLDNSPHASSSRDYRDRSSARSLSPSGKHSSPKKARDHFKRHHVSHSRPRWTKSEWDNLSLEIWEYYMKHRQTREMYSLKLQLRDRLYALLRTQYPFCGLYAVGSSMNGLGSNSSDMDLCFMVSLDEVDQRKEAKEILLHIKIMLSMTGISKSAQLIHAKVPILKFVDNITGIEVDLNVNNSVGIRNTYLLTCYSKLDWRVPPLVLVIKRWAKEHGINDAKMQTISSYSLVMMVIHYLQVGCNPPVLPSAQLIEPAMFNPRADIRSLSLLDKFPSFVSNNKQTLGELLLGFLNYYTNVFDFRRNAISVRSARAVPKHEVMFHKSPKNNADQWKYLCIEEPFDRTNTARSVYSEQPFKKILKVFRVSWHVLRDNKSLRSLIFSRGADS